MMKKIIKKNIFNSFVFSYLTLIAIVLVINLPVNCVLNNYISIQSEKINKYVLSDIGREFDDYFIHLKNNVHKIWEKANLDYDDILGKAYLTSDDYMTANTFKKFVSDSTYLGEYKVNSGVYYYKSDTILSDTGIYKSKDYYNVMHGKNEDLYYKWIDRLKSGSGFFTYKSGENASFMTYCMDCSKKGIQQSDVIIFAEVDTKIFGEKTEKMKNDTSENIVIFDDEHENIISTVNNDKTDKIMEDAEKNVSSVKTIRSADGKWTYAISFDGLKYMKISFMLTIMQALIAIFGMIIGIIYAFYASKKHTKPIKELAAKVNLGNSEISLNGNELNVLEQGIDKLRHNNIMLDAQSRKGIGIIKKQVMTKLLDGVFTDKDIQLFRQYYNKLDDNYFVVAVIEPEAMHEKAIFGYDFTDAETEVIFVNVLEELINNVYKGNVVYANGLFYCVINIGESENVADIHDIFEQAMGYIKQYFKLEFHVVVSTDVDKPELLFEAATQAERVLNLIRMKKIEGDIVFCHEVFGADVEHKELRNIRDKLKNYLAQGDSENASRLVDEWMADSIIKGVGFESIRMRLIIDLTYAVEAIMPECDNIKIKRPDPARELMMCDSIETLRENVYKFFDDFDKLSRNKSKKEDITETICAYIDDNYSDPDLSVNKLSSVFNYHSVYISRLFKEKRNATILEYISSVRMNNAKRMLRECDDTIEHIAVKSGYASINTFNRVFKKSEGITPSAYRNL